MRNGILSAAFIAALGVMCMTAMILPACSLLGSSIDEAALFKPLQLSWSDVSMYAERGITDALEAEELTDPGANSLRTDLQKVGAAIGAKDADALALLMWPTIAVYARRGIAAMRAADEIGDRGAESFSETIDLFNKQFAALQGGA